LGYDNFIKTYKDKPGWNIKEHDGFVVVSGKDPKSGRELIIAANKPESEHGLDKAKEYLKSIDAEPQFVVHRGHSYHTDKTLAALTDKTSAVFWGSCGGYQNIVKTLDASPDAHHMIVTKGEGTKVANDPLFKMINDAILKEGRVDWEKLWKQAQEQIKDKRFEQYIPPHQNTAASFIRGFNEQTKEQERTRETPGTRQTGCHPTSHRSEPLHHLSGPPAASGNALGRTLRERHHPGARSTQPVSPGQPCRLA
jgi:hypothetical protein